MGKLLATVLRYGPQPTAPHCPCAVNAKAAPDPPQLLISTSHKIYFVPVSTTSSGLAREVIPLTGAIGAYGIFMSFTSTTMSLFLADAVHAAPLLIGLYFVVRGIVAIAVNQAAGRL